VFCQSGSASRKRKDPCFGQQRETTAHTLGDSASEPRLLGEREKVPSRQSTAGEGGVQ